MYDLRVVVEEVKGFCDLPMRPGDYFEVRGGRILIPESKYVCLWALQSLLPMLPLKERELNEQNDWVPHTHRMCCPDPHGMVIFRIDRIGGRELQESGTNSQDKIPPRLLVNEKVCSGCRSCELACSLHHEGTFAPEMARLWVEKVEPEGLDRPHACRQCGNAACVAACSRKAVSREPNTKALVLDRTLCSGCGSCASACPFGAIRMARDGNGSVYPLVCDLCGGDPQCVKRCATGALRYGRAGDFDSKTKTTAASAQ